MGVALLFASLLQSGCRPPVNSSVVGLTEVKGPHVIVQTPYICEIKGSHTEAKGPFLIRVARIFSGSALFLSQKVDDLF